ncbi:MAG: DUF2797 domain-containing protein [Marinilabiliales bacterium]
MRVQNGEFVDYYLQLGKDEIYLNDLIGKRLRFNYLKKINCIHCGKSTTKSYGQGYCYNCFSTLPQTDVGIFRPELDKSHLGISRDMEWAKNNSLIDHYVYLSISSGLKVGVTRHTEATTRWIDQGAVQAIKFAITPNRYLAGTIEVTLKKYVPDKTNWRKMLMQEPDLGINLKEEKAKLIEFLPAEQKKYVTDDDWVYEFKYPVVKYPEKILAINLDVTSSFSEVLMGIKGQYLILDNNKVINIRKHNGYFVELEIL